MSDVFSASVFQFPYTDIRFPGQATDERILYVGREAKIMLYARLIFVVVAALVLTGVGLAILEVLGSFIGSAANGIFFLILLLGIVFGGIGLWWVDTTWKKSVFIFTNRRLTKFIYVTPWNRYNLSVTLDMIEDTGAYTKGYFRALFKIGTFTARSAAGNREEKYFFVDNVEHGEDLANYVNKLLFIFKHEVAKLETLRPFISAKSGEREEQIHDHPEFTG